MPLLARKGRANVLSLSTGFAALAAVLANLGKCVAI